MCGCWLLLVVVTLRASDTIQYRYRQHSRTHTIHTHTGRSPFCSTPISTLPSLHTRNRIPPSHPPSRPFAPHRPFPITPPPQVLRNLPGGGIDPGLCEIHPGGKEFHLRAAAAAAGVALNQVLLFDDMPANIAAASRVGAASQLLDPAAGLTRAAFAAGLAGWMARRRSSAMLTSWLADVDAVGGAGNSSSRRGGSKQLRRGGTAATASDTDEAAAVAAAMPAVPHSDVGGPMGGPGTLCHWE